MLRLRDIMTTDVITVTPEMTLRAAMELFSRHHISGAPVMSGSRVVGVISATDIVAFATTPPEMPSDMGGPPDEGVEWEDEDGWEGASSSSRFFSEAWTEVEDEGAEDHLQLDVDILDRYTVSEAMTWGVYSLPPAADVVAAAECMRSADVHRMLVMQDGKLLGIVSTMDLVRAVARNRIVRRTYVFDRSGDRD